MSQMPRVQDVVIPLLRDSLGLPVYGHGDAEVYSWIPYKSDRSYPVFNVRRLGGLPVDRRLLDRAVIELTAYDSRTLEDTEQLLLDAEEILWDAVRLQTPVAGVGYLHSYRQTMGPTQFDSPYDDTWRIQSLIQLGLRPL